MFASGLKVLVKVSVEFHELYGYSLTVLDIDPAYTLGDMLRKRMEIIRQLKEEGVFTLNKELPFPVLPKRIAVITSPTAAGYEDFLNQLANNKAGYPFLSEVISRPDAGGENGRVCHRSAGPYLPSYRLFRRGGHYPRRWFNFRSE